MVSSVNTSPSLSSGSRLCCSSASLLSSTSSRYRHEAGSTISSRWREDVALAALEIDADRIDGGVDHLAGDGALPDQAIELVLVGVELFLHRFRIGVDRIGRIASCASCAFFDWSCRSAAASAPCPRRNARRSGDGSRRCFLRQVDRVGTHIGDETGRPVGVDAFIELLRGAHGVLRGEAELARGFLQGRSENGAAGLRLRCFFSTEMTVGLQPAASSRARSTVLARLSSPC